jgi:trk system potassium uptake protein TrkH
VIRVMLLGKASLQELQRQIKPNAVRVLRIGKHVYREDVRRAVLGFFLIYMIVYAAGVLAMAAGGLDPLTAFSAASATLNMVGPGIAEVGALENYEVLSPFNRAVACFLMIAGRLEVFTVVALLAAAWERLRSVRLSF